MNDVKPCKFYSVKNTGKIQILWLLVFFNTCSIYNSPKVLSSQFRIISRFNKKACNRCSGFKTDCYRGFVEIVVLRYKLKNFELKHGEDRQFSAARRYKERGCICFWVKKSSYLNLYTKNRWIVKIKSDLRTSLLLSI